MASKIQNSNTSIILGLILLCIIAFLYTRYYEKMDKLYSDSNYDSTIRKYLANQDSPSLADKKKKPLLWIPINYEMNSRYWTCFGS